MYLQQRKCKNCVPCNGDIYYYPGMQFQWYEPVPKVDLSTAHLKEVDLDDLPTGIKQEISSSGDD